ncbi:uncharacterized protein LOC102809475, partial [Saccoglossus kowalevskii]
INCLNGKTYNSCGTCALTCGKETECVNSECIEGCFCPDGMYEDGDQCVDILDCGCEDENGFYHSVGGVIGQPNCESECICELGGIIRCYPIVCHEDAFCDLYEGVQGCHCNVGYQGTGQVCEDIDECTDGTNNCAADADCTNTIGSFTCECKHGFRGDGYVCDDINECLDGLHNCDNNADCVNTKGSFSCVCHLGYSGPGTSCEDIDECAEGTSSCHSISTECQNTIGSFICICHEGYAFLNQFRCTDVNECEAGTDNCLLDGTAKCKNLVGSFKCLCLKGYIGDGVTSCV